jgi:hypothetical protein
MNVHPRARPRIARISLFGIVITMMLAGVAAWVSSSHSAVKAAVVSPQIDPFSLMANAKNLPSQESLTLKMWPDNGVTHY